MTEAFSDTRYSHSKTSSSVHQKAVFTAFLERDSRYICLGLCYQKKLPSCPAPCDSAPPPPESSCSRSSFQRFLVSELKYTFPNTFRTARSRVSRNLNIMTHLWAARYKHLYSQHAHFTSGTRLPSAQCASSPFPRPPRTASDKGWVWRPRNEAIVCKYVALS